MERIQDTRPDPNIFLFLLPTHQVNALTMGPGNYRVADFMRAGSGLSVLYIIVLVTMINWLY